MGLLTLSFQETRINQMGEQVTQKVPGIVTNETSTPNFYERLFTGGFKRITREKVFEKYL
jgi:hypothetical protein